MSEIRSVDLVIPLYDEEDALPGLIERLRSELAALAIPWRAILVDDGSRDRSWQIVSAAAAEDLELEEDPERELARLVAFAEVTAPPRAVRRGRGGRG